MREVETASARITERHGNDEFAVSPSRLSDIETKGLVPSIFRLYSLAVIYGCDVREVLSWYGVDLSLSATDLELNLPPRSQNCVTCKLRKDKWFCGLSPDVLRSFSDSSHLSTYPGGAILFVEGQMPRGGLVLCSGKVKLSTTSRDGKVLILKMAVPGEALGLSAVISGTPYELTAETAGPCQVNSIDRDSLMRLLDKYGELGLHSAQALSREFQSAYREIHELVLARSSAGKLARLLLSWGNSREREGGTSEIRIKSSLTHEEIAQMIGSSRETVTRL
jgi:CRP/FNR family transcriptional regulator, cyclic AMP receptor protein